MQLSAPIGIRKPMDAADLQKEGSVLAPAMVNNSIRGDPWSSEQQLESNIREFSDVPMNAGTFHSCALLCEVRMHLLGRC